MKKYSTSFLLILTFLNVSSIYSQEIKEENIDSILKLKPPIKYDENLKYQEINKYIESWEKNKKSNYDFGINVDINKELKTIEGIKIDVGTNF
jgi:hypothetical protein